MGGFLNGVFLRVFFRIFCKIFFRVFLEVIFCDVNLTFHPAYMYIYGGEVLLAGQADIGWRWQFFFPEGYFDEYFLET